MLSNSLTAEAHQYWRTRLFRGRIGALLALLFLTLLAANPVLSMTDLPGRAGWLAAAMALLRLWDDLADRDYDRARHPQRTLVTSAHLSAFATILAGGLLMSASVFVDDTGHLMVYAALILALGLLYHSRLGRKLPRPVRTLLVLSKYPVLVFLAGAGPSVRAWLAVLVLYAALGVYEWLDDGELRRAPAHQVWLGATLAVAMISGPLLQGDTTS